ncbi:MAG: hypothetical protein NC218_07290 [Acetobacter sp.]|nr:hypothetical protein [Acetobacter sp.]
MTNTNKKITKAMRNTDIIAMLTGGEVKHGTTVEDAVAHLTHENELLAKKNSGDAKKPTKVQAENAKLKEEIVAFLTTVDKGVTATEVMNACNLSSNQKAAALLRALVEAGEVSKTVEKGKALFALSTEG